MPQEYPGILDGLDKPPMRSLISSSALVFFDAFNGTVMLSSNDEIFESLLREVIRDTIGGYLPDIRE